MKTIGIVGSRRKNQDTHYKKVLKAFYEVYEENDVIVSGGCPKGGDKFAYWIAKEMGLTMTIHFPAWDRFGKAAGFIRNTKIASDADILIACASDDREGGTEDTIKKFLKDNPEENLRIVL